jgi:thiamine-monophosphate kinase
MKKDKQTPVSEIGEFGLIERLNPKKKSKHASTIKGVGDDAAVLEFGDKYVLVTTDMLAEGMHFNLVYTPLQHLGYKSVIVNLSDIYAMNGLPTQVTVSLAISAKFSVEHLEELYKGIYLACEKHGVDLVGGDTTSSLTGLTLSITCIGEVEKNKVTYRNGANPTDLVCVSGNLGGAYAGLQVLEREHKLFSENENFTPKLEGYEYVLERQLKPEGRRDTIELLDKLGIVPTSMMDISDGLSSEMYHICTQSKTGADIYQDKVPVDMETAETARELNIDPLICALNGGEDYELLFTVPLTEHEKIAEQQGITIIGHITEARNGLNLVTNDGRKITLQAQGWDPLKGS